MHKGLTGLFLLSMMLISTVCAAPLAVDVVSVRFSEKRLPGQSQPWLEAAISLRAVRSNVEDVDIQMWLRFRQNINSGSVKGTRYQTFFGKTSLYALDKNVVVRFYIPPDMVRVRRLSQTPEAYRVVVSSSYGREVWATVSPNLINKEDTISMDIKSPAPALLPHYSTPFYSISDTFRDLPSYVIP